MGQWRAGATGKRMVQAGHPRAALTLQPGRRPRTKDGLAGLHTGEVAYWRDRAIDVRVVGSRPPLDVRGSGARVNTPRDPYAAMVARFTGSLSVNDRRGTSPHDINSSAHYARPRRRRTAAKPARPLASSIRDPGSGTPIEFWLTVRKLKS